MKTRGLTRWDRLASKAESAASGKAKDQSPVMSGRRHLAAVCLLALLVLLSYAATLNYEFVYDDKQQILRNPFLLKGAAWKPLIVSDVWSYQDTDQRALTNYYRPLQMLTYRLTSEVAGLEPRAFHFVNLLFHFGATLLAYVLLVRLTGRPELALWAAALFALHPIHTEAVDWVAALPDLGCAAFYFLSFYLFSLLIERDPYDTAAGERAEAGRPLQQHYALWMTSLVCFALALLWKEMALTLPLIIVTYSLFLMPRRDSFVARVRRAVCASLPYWGVVAVYLLARYRILGYLSRVQQPWGLSPSQYILNAVALVSKYWLKLFLPFGLNAFHVFEPVASLRDPRAAASIAFLIAAGVLTLYGLWRNPLPGFAAAWIFLTLIPILNLRGVGENTFAERYAYIPSFGFCLLFAWSAEKLRALLPTYRLSAGVTAALVIVAALYLLQTVSRNSVWKDDLTLYSRTVAASPDSPVMHASFAAALLQKGDVAGAEQQYSLAIAAAMKSRVLSDPRDLWSGQMGLASVYVTTHRYEQALSLLDSLRAEIMRYPSDAALLRGLEKARAVTLLNMGQIDEAQMLFESLNQAKPKDGDVINALGTIAVKRKNYEQAIAYFQRVLGTTQKVNIRANALDSLGAVYFVLGRYREASEQLQGAVEIAPNNHTYHTDLGMALARSLRNTEAREEFQRALMLAPNDANARAALAALGRIANNSPIH